MNEFAGKIPKGVPKGLGLGASALIALGGLAYAGVNSLFTVEGGHRAIIFNRIGGVDMNTVYSEGLHFRVPYFQYPITYDIRAKPRLIKSPTGSKGNALYLTILQLINVKNEFKIYQNNQSLSIYWPKSSELEY